MSKRWFPKIEFVDYIPDLNNKLKARGYVIGDYRKDLNRIQVLKNCTKHGRIILHELIHWLIYKLPFGDKKIDQLHNDHDKRSTFTTERVK